MKIFIELEIDVRPNEIAASELDGEISANLKDLKEYFSDDESHWLHGLRWEGQKVIRISKKL